MKLKDISAGKSNNNNNSFKYCNWTILLSMILPHISSSLGFKILPPYTVSCKKIMLHSEQYV